MRVGVEEEEQRRLVLDQVERRVAVRVRRVRRRAPAAEQVLCGWRLARRHRTVQRRAAVGGARAHQRRIGAKEDAERVWAAVRRGEADRVHAVVAPHERRAGASVEQDLEHASVAVHRSVHQRRRAVVVRRVELGAE